MKCSTCKSPIVTKPIPLWHKKKVCNRCYSKFKYKQKLLNYAIRKGKAVVNLKVSNNGWKITK